MCKGVRSVIGAVFLFYVLRLQKSLREAQCTARSAVQAEQAAKPLRALRLRLRRPPSCGADLQAPWLPGGKLF